MDARGATMEIAKLSLQQWAPKQILSSRSKRGVLRGLHLHTRQQDLWHLIEGRMQVGLVDLRKRTTSPATTTFEWSGDDPRALQIPAGVAHGYLALTDITILYVMSEEHDPSDEFSIAWNDPTFDLAWGTAQPLLSARDAGAARLDWDKLPAPIGRDA